MSEEITTVKYLINQLVDVRVACQFWIDKDHESQERINKLEEHNTLLKERFEKDESSYLDATKAAFKRYIDAEGIRPNERFSKVVKQLQMYLPTDNESIDDKKIILEQSKRINELKELNEELKSGETILKYQDTLGEQQARIKELEEQLAYSYDSGLEAIDPEDMTPDPTPEERKAYNKDRIQEFIKEHLQEDPRDYPEELQYE